MRYLFTRVINFQHVFTSTKALIDVCVIICFGWQFHEILLNTVYLRELCNVDAVDVRVLHNAFNLTYPIVDLRCPSILWYAIGISFSLSVCDAKCF